MKEASGVMYKIGKVFNIIGIVLYGIYIVIGISIAASGGAIGGSLVRFIIQILEEYGVDTSDMGSVDPETIASAVIVFYGVVFIFVSLVNLGLRIAALLVIGKNREKIDAGSLEVAPHVFTLVFGGLISSVFYILSGIFGLIARNKEIKAKRMEEALKSDEGEML